MWSTRRTVIQFATKGPRKNTKWPGNWDTTWQISNWKYLFIQWSTNHYCKCESWSWNMSWNSTYLIYVFRGLVKPTFGPPPTGLSCNSLERRCFGNLPCGKMENTDGTSSVEPNVWCWDLPLLYWQACGAKRWPGHCSNTMVRKWGGWWDNSWCLGC